MECLVIRTSLLLLYSLTFSWVSSFIVCMWRVTISPSTDLPNTAKMVDSTFNIDGIRVLKSPSVVGIDKIYIHFTSNDVLAIQMSYRDINGTCSLGYYHGDGTARGGNNAIISLLNEEYLSRITGRYSTTIHYLAFDIKILALPVCFKDRSTLYHIRANLWDIRLLWIQN